MSIDTARPMHRVTPLLHSRAITVAYVLYSSHKPLDFQDIAAKCGLDAGHVFRILPLLATIEVAESIEPSRGSPRWHLTTDYVTVAQRLGMLLEEP